MLARITLPITALCALLLFPVLLRAEEAQNAVVKNEFIRIVVNKGPAEAGRFSIDTTGGDPTRPTSRNQQLIYGGAAPWTSITTVRIDDALYVFGGKTERRSGLHANYGEVVSGPKVEGNSIVTTCRYGDVLVTQELSLVRGASSSLLDTAGITYRITNQGKNAHTVGVRVLLDTKLGKNDGAPIRAGKIAIKNATTVSPDNLLTFWPDVKAANAGASPEGSVYWQAFDSLSDPTVISQGTFRGPGISSPDKMVFADWGTLADDIWEVKLDPERGFLRKDEDEDDTAMALYWNPVTVDPGKSISHTTHYGVGYANISPAKLTLGLTATKESTFEYERTQPIMVTGYLRNDSILTSDITIKLKLPEGFALLGDPKAATQTFKECKPEDEFSATWMVVPTGKASGKLAIALEASTPENRIEANRTTWDIQVYVPKPQLVLTPNIQQVKPKTAGRATMVPIKVNLKPSVDFYATRYVLTYDSAVMKPLIVSRGDALVEDGRFLGGWEFDTSEDGKITISASRGNAGKLTQAEINLATITFRVAGNGKCALALENAVLIDDKGAESPVMTSAGLVEVTP